MKIENKYFWNDKEIYFIYLIEQTGVGYGMQFGYFEVHTFAGQKCYLSEF